jgi:threonine dehydratase
MTAAREFLSRYLARTPLMEARSLSGARNPEGAGRVFLKLETELPTGSFKARGALYALNVALDRRAAAGQNRLATAVVAASTGNHGAAVAWAAQRLGVPATIFLPRNPNPVKKANIAQFGATIVEEGRDLADAFQAASTCADSTGAFFLNDATDADLPEGPATIADEIIEELPEVDVIYVPVGDTALIRGVGARAKSLKPSIRIVGVQAERAPSYFLSWQSGQVETTETADTIADGLATRTPDAKNVRDIRQCVDDMRLVSEASMKAAIDWLYREEGIVAEPAAASTVAALLNAGAPYGATVLLITGKNVAPDLDPRSRR